MLKYIQVLVHDNLLEFQIPIDITYHQKIQLAHDVCKDDWYDAVLLDPVLICTASALHIPIVLHTKSASFPIVPFLPDNPPLAPTTPIHIAIADEGKELFVPCTLATSSHYLCGQKNIDFQSSCTQDISTTATQVPLVAVNLENPPSVNQPSLQINQLASTCGLPQECYAFNNSSIPDHPMPKGSNSSTIPSSLINSSSADDLSPIHNNSTQGSKTVAETSTLPQNSPTPPTNTLSDANCTCGHRTSHMSCNNTGKYNSRCPCLRLSQPCTSICKCTNCHNPFGKRIVPARKRPQLIMATHKTTNKKAISYLTDQSLPITTGQHNRQEYLLLACLLHQEYGVNYADPVPMDDIMDKYNTSRIIAQKMKPDIALFQRESRTLKSLVQDIKFHYECTVSKGLTHSS